MHQKFYSQQIFNDRGSLFIYELIVPDQNAVPLNHTDNVAKGVENQEILDFGKNTREAKSTTLSVDKTINLSNLSDVFQYEFFIWLLDRDYLGEDANISTLKSMALAFYPIYILSELENESYMNIEGLDKEIFSILVCKFSAFITDGCKFVEDDSRDKISADILEYWESNSNRPGIALRFVNKYFANSQRLLMELLKHLNELQSILAAADLDNSEF
jgi:hypothetical protein